MHEKRTLKAQKLAYAREMSVHKKSNPPKKLSFELFLSGETMNRLNLKLRNKEKESLKWTPLSRPK